MQKRISTIRIIQKCILSICILFSLTTHAAPEQIKPNVLLLHFVTPYWGGMEVHTLNRYKKLLEHGFNAHFLIVPNSQMQDELIKRKLPYLPFSTTKPNLETLESDIYQTCLTHKIDIIMCNLAGNLTAAKKVAKLLPSLKIVFVQHMHIGSGYHRMAEELKGINGLIGVSPEITNAIKQMNNQFDLGIKAITYIPPFFDEEKFLTFTTQQTREEFFKQEFNIALTGHPIFCMIANMYAQLEHKNYPLLFRAIQKLVYQKKKPVQVMLAGDGVQRKHFEQLAQQLHIEKYVHFLGFVSKTADLLHHVDFHVLASSEEAFGQVHVEAALMGKASIGATKTGATATIDDGITGLLFKNNNEDSLVEKIEYLIDYEKLRQEMGKDAQVHARATFSNESQYTQINTFFEQIMCATSKK
jgi:glycosyltransferase involved in cell wall biosynthesis